MKFMDVLDPLQMRKGGLLWKPIKQATGLTDAQMIGIGALATGGAIAAPALLGASGGAAAGTAGASAPAAGQALTLGGGVPDFAAEAAAPQGGGLLSTIGKVGSAVGTGVNAANAAGSLMRQQPIQGGQIQPRQGPDISSLVSAQAQQQQAMTQEQQARKQQQQQVISGLLNGGLYGRNS